jgi:hypothetical protein
LTTPGATAADSNPSANNAAAAVGSPASASPAVEVCGESSASTGAGNGEQRWILTKSEDKAPTARGGMEGEDGSLSMSRRQSVVAVASASGEVELAPLALVQPSRASVEAREKLPSSAPGGPVDVDEPAIPDAAPPEPATEYIPLALARIYKLRLVDDPRPRWLQPSATSPPAQAADAGAEEDPELQAPSTASAVDEYTPEELGSLVRVVFPANGGRIRAQEPPPISEGQQDGGAEPTRYDVVDRDGVVRRTLVVREGRVFRVVAVEGDGGNHGSDGKRARSSIRLGLGDFIFYSILVSEAASYSFTTFCACALVVLGGLGLTLLLLAVRGKALPALPISIFLGVAFYLLTRYFIQPWVQSVLVAQAYV